MRCAAPVARGRTGRNEGEAFARDGALLRSKGGRDGCVAGSSEGLSQGRIVPEMGTKVKPDHLE